MSYIIHLILCVLGKYWNIYQTNIQIKLQTYDDDSTSYRAYINGKKWEVGWGGNPKLKSKCENSWSIYIFI